MGNTRVLLGVSLHVHRRPTAETQGQGVIPGLGHGPVASWAATVSCANPRPRSRLLLKHRLNGEVAHHRQAAAGHSRLPLVACHWLIASGQREQKRNDVIHLLFGQTAVAQFFAIHVLWHGGHQPNARIPGVITPVHAAIRADGMGGESSPHTCNVTLS